MGAGSCPLHTKWSLTLRRNKFTLECHRVLKLAVKQTINLFKFAYSFVKRSKVSNGKYSCSKKITWSNFEHLGRFVPRYLKTQKFVCKMFLVCSKKYQMSQTILQTVLLKRENSPLFSVLTARFLVNNVFCSWAFFCGIWYFLVYSSINILHTLRPIKTTGFKSAFSSETFKSCWRPFSLLVTRITRDFITCKHTLHAVLCTRSAYVDNDVFN